MAASVKQKFVQKSRETSIENRPHFCSILNKFLRFEVALTSEDGHKGCHVVLRSQGNLKMQKFIQKSCKIAIRACAKILVPRVQCTQQDLTIGVP